MHGPIRQAAQELYTNVLELGRYAREQYLAEVRAGKRVLDFTELRDLDENLKIIEAELGRRQ